MIAHIFLLVYCSMQQELDGEYSQDRHILKGKSILFTAYAKEVSCETNFFTASKMVVKNIVTSKYSLLPLP